MVWIKLENGRLYNWTHIVRIDLDNTIWFTNGKTVTLSEKEFQLVQKVLEKYDIVYDINSIQEKGFTLTK